MQVVKFTESDTKTTMKARGRFFPHSEGPLIRAGKLNRLTVAAIAHVGQTTQGVADVALRLLADMQERDAVVEMLLLDLKARKG